MKNHTSLICVTLIGFLLITSCKKDEPEPKTQNTNEQDTNEPEETVEDVKKISINVRNPSLDPLKGAEIALTNEYYAYLEPSFDLMKTTDDDGNVVFTMDEISDKLGAAGSGKLYVWYNKAEEFLTNHYDVPEEISFDDRNDRSVGITARLSLAAGLMKPSKWAIIRAEIAGAPGGNLAECMKDNYLKFEYKRNSSIGMHMSLNDGTVICDPDSWNYETFSGEKLNGATFPEQSYVSGNISTLQDIYNEEESIQYSSMSINVDRDDSLTFNANVSYETGGSTTSYQVTYYCYPEE